MNTCQLQSMLLSLCILIRIRACCVIWKTNTFWNRKLMRTWKYALLSIIKSTFKTRLCIIINSLISPSWINILIIAKCRSLIVYVNIHIYKALYQKLFFRYALCILKFKDITENLFMWLTIRLWIFWNPPRI